MQRIPRRSFIVAFAIMWALFFGGVVSTAEAQESAPQEPAATEKQVERSAQDQPITEAQRHFVRRVMPLLEAKCLACHGGKPEEVQGEFLLTSRTAMLQGGESGEPAVIAGDPDASPLIRAVRWQDLEMPPKENDRLTPQQITDLASWVRDGRSGRSNR